MKINNREAQQKAKSGLPFNIKVGEKNLQFILRLNDIRAKEYKSYYTDKQGLHVLPKGEAFTYKSTIIGERNSAVALTVDGSKVEGYLATKDEGFFIEPAKKYSPHAADDDKVIYKSKDKIKQDDGICGLDEAVAAQVSRMESVQEDQIESNSADTYYDPEYYGDGRIIEVATEADKDYVQTLAGGDPLVANNQLISVLNQVDVLYQRQLKLKVVVTFQHAWEPNTADPYVGKTLAKDLLDKFAEVWNAQFPKTDSRFHRDVAQMFTTKVTYYNNQAVYGMAYPFSACVVSSETYSMVSNPNPSKWLSSAHELAHNLSASDLTPSINPSCEFSIMNRTQFRDTSTEFCSRSLDEIRIHLNYYNSCLALNPNYTPRIKYDFDGDGLADISLFRPSDRTWYLERSNDGFFSIQYGFATDIRVPADYDGDGKTDVAVFRDGTWYIERSAAGYLSKVHGVSGDIPAPGDFNGDGRAELAVFSPSNGNWSIFDIKNNQIISSVQFGQNGDKPVVGDYDGDLKADIAVFRPSNTTWYIQQSSGGLDFFQFGSSNDKLIPGDYDGDSKTDAVVYRASDATWYMRLSNLGTTSAQFGYSTDIIAPADYDGDGKIDLAVFRNGTWVILQGFTNQPFFINFGQTGDFPIPTFIP